jgi:hypothetical protein
MIFKPELAAKVMAGEKTVTRRLCSANARSPWWRERTIYVEGKVFTVNPGRGVNNIGRACVVSSRREDRVDSMNRAEARREGFPSVEQFAVAFAEINGCYPLFKCVWRIEFEVIA